MQHRRREGGFFRFAVDYHNREKIAEKSWEPAEGLLAEFRQWLIDEEIATGEEADEMLAEEKAKSYTRRQIHSDIFTAAFGTEAANQVLARGDVQIQAALDLFDQAHDLLAMRHELKGAPTELMATSLGGRTMQGKAEPEGGDRPE